MGSSPHRVIGLWKWAKVNRDKVEKDNSGEPARLNPRHTSSAVSIRRCRLNRSLSPFKAEAPSHQTALDQKLEVMENLGGGLSETRKSYTRGFGCMAIYM